MEPRLRASEEQFSVLLDFMERHGDLSKPQSGQERLECDRLWQELTIILNSVGSGVRKSLDKWKKVWADWKTKTKKKCLRSRLQASGTDGGPTRRITITPLEKRVAAFTRLSAVDGQGIQEQDFHDGSTNEFLWEHPQYALEIVSEDHDNQNVEIPTPASPVTVSVDSVPQPEEDTPASATPAPSPSPPPQSPPTLPRIPPARNNGRQAWASARPTSNSPRQAFLRGLRNRRLTPFDRVANLFATIEHRRLVHEEARDKRLHEREMEKLRLEAERIDITRAQNELLHQLSRLGERLIDVITQQRPGSLPSTDPI